MAELLGKEAAVFLPTGTLANHLALRLLARNGRRVIVQRESHLYCDEGDTAQRLSGVTLLPLAPGRAVSRLDEAVAAIDGLPDARVVAQVGAISMRLRCAAWMVPPSTSQRCNASATMLESAYSGVPPSVYAALFVTVYVSLWKYLNAASGAILAGTRSLLDGLYHERRMFGGGLPDAAVALHFPDGFEAAVTSAGRLLAALRHRVHVEVPASPPMWPCCAFPAPLQQHCPSASQSRTS